MKRSERGKIDIICSLVLLMGSIYLFSQGSMSLSSYLSERYIETDISPGKSSYIISENKEQIGILSLEFSNTQKLILEGSGTLMLADNNARVLFVTQANLLGQVQSGKIRISTEQESITFALTGISPIHITTSLQTRKKRWSTTDTIHELLEIQSQMDSGVRLSHNTVPRYFQRAFDTLGFRLQKASTESPAFSQSSTHITWKQLKKVFLKEQMKEPL